MLSHHTALRLFDALAQFPHLSTDARARIANAAETRHPATWADAREVRLDPGHSRSTSLQDVCKPTHGTLPTASEIIAGLHYAAGALA